MDRNDTHPIERHFILDIAATIEALADVANRHLDELTTGEALILLGARDIADHLLTVAWGNYGSRPDGRL